MPGRPEALHGRPSAWTRAWRALAEGIPACPHCRPDAALGMLE
ncbi:DUF6233 domain-containing protein [Streptomyces sp. NPDC090741]